MSFQLNTWRIKTGELKILVIGAGSIGKRHIANLSGLGYKDIAVVSRSIVVPGELKVSGIYNTLSAALAAGCYDVAFVCTPTSRHIEDLAMLLQNGARHIYVEKPLSDSINGLHEILSSIEKTGANIIVGYDLHFEPGLQKIKQLLQHNIIGKIISANAFVGQYLPQWRPHQDHREGMSAKKETGGGVMLDLIHEIDYLYRLLGKVQSVACACTNTHALEIETEEAAEMLLKFSNGVMATVHLDYWQPVLKRNCFFTGTKGTIYWDLVKNIVTVTDLYGQQEEFNYASFQRNNRFRLAIKTFLEQPEDERLTGVKQAIESLKIVLAAKHAAENNYVVKLADFNHLV